MAGKQDSTASRKHWESLSLKSSCMYDIGVSSVKVVDGWVVVGVGATAGVIGCHAVVGGCGVVADAFAMVVVVMVVTAMLVVMFLTVTQTMYIEDRCLHTNKHILCFSFVVMLGCFNHCFFYGVITRRFGDCPFTTCELLCFVCTVVFPAEQ